MRSLSFFSSTESNTKGVKSAIVIASSAMHAWYIARQRNTKSLTLEKQEERVRERARKKDKWARDWRKLPTLNFSWKSISILQTKMRTKLYFHSKSIMSNNSWASSWTRFKVSWTWIVCSRSSCGRGRASSSRSVPRSLSWNEDFTGRFQCWCRSYFFYSTVKTA